MVDESVRAAPLRVAPVGDVPWEHVETVFGTRGDPSTCWCQWFRMPRREFDALDASELRDRARTQSRSHPSPGVVAYLGDEPVGWCAISPRTEYPVIQRSTVGRAAPDATAADVWTVSCFVVRVGFRRGGVAGALLAGAVAFARSNGARVVEGFPVDPSMRTSTSSAELYHGTVTLFERAGFEIVARPTPARTVARLELA